MFIMLVHKKLSAILNISIIEELLRYIVENKLKKKPTENIKIRVIFVGMRKLQIRNKN